MRTHGCFGPEDEGKTRVWKRKHLVKCVVKEVLLPKMTMLIYSILPFSFQTCSPACFSICDRTPCLQTNRKKPETLGITWPVHSFSPPWSERFGQKKNPLLGSQERVCVRCRNVLLIFLDNLPLNKNCWCWSCKDWINFLRGSNCKISRKLLGNANFCSCLLALKCSALNSTSLHAAQFRKMELFSVIENFLVDWASEMWHQALLSSGPYKGS